MPRFKKKPRRLSLAERRRRLDLQVGALEREAESLSRKRGLKARDLGSLRIRFGVALMEALQIGASEPAGRAVLAVFPLIATTWASQSNGTGLNECFQWCRRTYGRNRRLLRWCWAMCRLWFLPR